MSFPLPIASQEHYTKWFKYNIKKGSFKKYTIVWVGKQLDKRFKSDVSPDILPENVFICQKKDNYEYILIHQELVLILIFHIELILLYQRVKKKIFI